MIRLTDYKQFVAELTAAASRQCGIRADHIRLAATISQLTAMLKDKPGIILCGNLPPCDLTRHPDGYWKSGSECLLYVVQKMPADQAGTDTEDTRMQQLQTLMAAVVTLLADPYQTSQFCDRFTVDIRQPIRIEWEYNEFGGFNGLSVSFTLTDQQGTAL